MPNVPGELAFDTLHPEDLDAVLEIERVSFPTPWTRDQFLFEIRDNGVAWNPVLRDSERVRAYACTWIVADRMEINDVAVEPALRGRGLGRELLRHALDVARARGCGSARLEVRPSNLPAIALYRSLGFREVGRRPRYYDDTGEDAVLMNLELGKGA